MVHWKVLINSPSYTAIDRFTYLHHTVLRVYAACFERLMLQTGHCLFGMLRWCKEQHSAVWSTCLLTHCCEWFEVRYDLLFLFFSIIE